MKFNLKADKIELEFSDDQPIVVHPEPRRFVADVLNRLVRAGKLKPEDAASAQHEAEQAQQP
ncbi:MAG: hypothetical protein QY325_04225 [Flavobacteriales bacterium]|nr:MAG: hypothetical protein QY325_04225 [Flavobacteriales bacterium]